MRIAVLGGTRFIGVAIVEELLRGGHEVLVVHSGKTEADGQPSAPHVHLERSGIGELSRALRDFRADTLVDTCAYSREDAEGALAALGTGMFAVVLSSQDVYRAWMNVLRSGASTEPVPLDEEAPVRGPDQRYAYRDMPSAPTERDPQTYEKLDVEEVYRAHGGAVLRLSMIYGPRDFRAREAFILDRVRAGRRRIPFGAGTLLWSRAYVDDVGVMVRRVVEERAAEVWNVAEARSWTIEGWALRILAAAGSDAELVRVPDAALPADLSLSRTVAQPLLVDASKARARLGFSPTDPEAGVARSVAWHLRQPIVERDFADDDRALAQS